MTHSPFILCIETGTDTCSVALAQNGALVALRETHGERDHARRVATYTEEVLAEAGIEAGGNGRGGFSYAELAAVAVSKGPGSYTGLRIGVSFAKGLCYGLGIPLIGVGSLESLCEIARANYSGTLFIPMIDARRMEVYGQVFDTHGRPLTPPGAWIIDEGSLSEFRPDANARPSPAAICIFGSGAEKCREALPWAHLIDVKPSARGMIRLATAACEAKNFEDTAYFEPFYLKDFVVTTSTKKLF